MDFNIEELSNIAQFIKRYGICRTFERMQSANTTEVGPVLYMYRKEGKLL
jgi:hypothetical protein